MPSRKLHANPRLPLRHHRITEPHHANHTCSSTRRANSTANFALAQHDGHNRVLPRPDIEPRPGCPLAKLPRVRRQSIAQLRRAGDQIQHRQTRAHDYRRQRVAEQIRPRAVAQQFNNLTPPRREPARRPAQRLA